ncbi:MAG: Gfo/Idh/MocA family protein [Victivallaceae bacterium]
MAKVRFGLIGCGKIAEANHFPEVLSLGKDGEIVAMYDIKPGAAAKLAKKFKSKAVICKSEAELLAADIDAVIIATPNCFHYPQTLAALNAGKHVLVEKPMASRIADADAMIDLARKKKLVLHVNQSMRYVPLWCEIKRRLDAGAIGTPIHARCLRAASASPDVGWSKGATWFVQKKYEGSLVTDIAVHMADALQWFFGPVKSILALNRNRTHEVPDNVNALLDFANGATGSLELSWTFPTGCGALELYGEKGTLRMLADGSGFEIIPAGGKAPTVVKAADVPAVANSHACFVEEVRNAAADGWLIGRNALALCCAIIESDLAQAAIKPQYRKAPAAPAKKAAPAKAAVKAAPAKKAAPVKAAVKAPAKKAAPAKAPVAKAPVAKAPVAKAPVAKAPVAKAPAKKAAAKKK